MTIDQVGTYIFIALVGFLAIAYVISEIQRVRHVKNWPRLSGRITSSSVFDVHDEYGSISIPYRTYRVQVNYVYEVTGQALKGSHSTPATWSSRQAAEELCALYVVGKELPIVYNPQRVTESLLAESGQENISVYAILVGLGIVSLVCFFISLWLCNFLMISWFAD